MKRPKTQLPEIPKNLADLAGRCKYVGSVEHKDKKSWLGLPQPRRRPRQTATICPLYSNEDRDRATEWVRAAIRAGNFRKADWQGGLPRHIWYRDEQGNYWRGFLTNAGAGEYKGWPITEEEWREDFDRMA